MYQNTFKKPTGDIERKECKFLDNHTCPVNLSKAKVGESCDGCSLMEKVLHFKALSLQIEEQQRLDFRGKVGG